MYLRFFSLHMGFVWRERDEKESLQQRKGKKRKVVMGEREGDRDSNRSRN